MEVPRKIGIFVGLVVAVIGFVLLFLPVSVSYSVLGSVRCGSALPTFMSSDPMRPDECDQAAKDAVLRGGIVLVSGIAVAFIARIVFDTEPFYYRRPEKEDDFRHHEGWRDE